MKKGIIAACLWPAFWIGLSLVYVNKEMVVRHEPEKYGWEIVIGMAALTIPTAFIAYQAGKKDQD